LELLRLHESILNFICCFPRSFSLITLYKCLLPIVVVQEEEGREQGVEDFQRELTTYREEFPVRICLCYEFAAMRVGNGWCSICLTTIIKILNKKKKLIEMAYFGFSFFGSKIWACFIWNNL
jgi:hypothetical protein